jgi:hypothetical protein
MSYDEIPSIERWQIGSYFGQHAVRGYVYGVRRTFVLLWISHQRFGVTTTHLKNQTRLRIGEPGKEPWGIIGEKR